MRTSKYNTPRIIPTFATLATLSALSLAAPAVYAQDDSTSESSESSESSQTQQETTGEPDFGTDYYDFRCINDAWRLNETINYHRTGTPLPTGPTIVVELDQAGCEILGNDEGGVAYCRCEKGKLSTHSVPASWLPTLHGGTDDLYRLAPVCVRAVREFCGVEPKEVPEPGSETSSSVGEESSSEESSGGFDTSTGLGEGDGTSSETGPDTSGDPMTEDGAGNDGADREKVCGMGQPSSQGQQDHGALPVERIVGCSAKGGGLKDGLLLPLLAFFVGFRRVGR